MRSGIAVVYELVGALLIIGESELEAYCNKEGKSCDGLLCARHGGQIVRCSIFGVCCKTFLRKVVEVLELFNVVVKRGRQMASFGVRRACLCFAVTLELHIKSHTQHRRKETEKKGRLQA